MVRLQHNYIVVSYKNHHVGKYVLDIKCQHCWVNLNIYFLNVLIGVSIVQNFEYSYKLMKDLSIEQPFQKMDEQCLLLSFQHGLMFWFLKSPKLFKVLMNCVSFFGDCSVSIYVNNYEIAQKKEINRLYAPSDCSLPLRHEGFTSLLPGVLTGFITKMDHCHPPLFHSRWLSTNSRFILLSWMEPQTDFFSCDILRSNPRVEVHDFFFLKTQHRSFTHLASPKFPRLKSYVFFQ